MGNNCIQVLIVTATGLYPRLYTRYLARKWIYALNTGIVPVDLKNFTSSLLICKKPYLLAATGHTFKYFTFDNYVITGDNVIH